jgi:Tfp pilus assembly protein PilF
MTGKRYPFKTTVTVITLGLLGAAGCQHAGPAKRPEAAAAPSPSPIAAKPERAPKLTGRQVADVQIAQGRSLEKQGELAQAAASYQEALKRDPDRADAYLRLAIVNDRQGKFKESQELYLKALKGMPGNADVYCDVGYSLSLQQRWAEAEMNLRQAVAVEPGHRRAHNNLGLVLAHEGRPDEALAEFRRAGCSEADGHANLAYVYSLEKHLGEARQHYEHALAVDASSEVARKGLKELDSLAARPATDGVKQASATTAARAQSN